MFTIISIIDSRPDGGEDIKRYVRRKIGRLDSYVPRKSREEVRAEVRLSTSGDGTRRESTCEVELHLPHASLRVTETTSNMFAAVDIVTARLKNELVTASRPASLRHMLSKLRR